MGPSDLTIRPEQTRDIPSVREVNRAAFPTPAEANLVDELRDAAKPTVSLVAVLGGAKVSDKIEVIESMLGRGTTFTLHLPAL